MALSISRICTALLVAGIVATDLGAQTVNPHAQVLEGFEDRVRQYTKLQKQAEASVPALKPTDSPDRIRTHEQLLAGAIRRQRNGSTQGNLFTPEISAEFARLIGITLQGSGARRIRASLRHSEPVDVPLRINGDYPEDVPLQTTPPTLLLNLPKLPAGLEYRVVGLALVLRDAKANLIVDFIPKALSHL
jgi:hypothetical protein